MPKSAYPWINDYRLHSVHYHPDAIDTKISGIVSGGITANADVLKEVTAGQMYPEAASLQTLRPLGNFTSYNLEQLLGSGGPGIEAGTGFCLHDALSFFFAKQECAGPSASDALEYAVTDGIIVPTTLNVDHRGSATLSYDIYMADDQGVAPIVKTEDVTLPTLTGSDKRWTFERMTIGGATVWGKRSLNINFNPTVTQEGADSTTYDSVTSLEHLQPIVAIGGVDPGWLHNNSTTDGVTGLAGEQVAKADTVLYFKERTTNGAGNDWITLAFNGLLSWDTIVQGDVNSPATSALRIDVVTDGTDAILATTGVAPPTPMPPT